MKRKKIFEENRKWVKYLQEKYGDLEWLDWTFRYESGLKIKTKVEVQLNHYDLRVLIDGLVHVLILRKDFVGFQSWNEDENMWVIEFCTTANKIKTEYDTKEKWVATLKALSEKL